MKNYICCLKVGNKYSSDYVNNLYLMTKKYSKNVFDFYCFTDNEKNILKEINIIKLPFLKNIQGWFYKLSLFDKNINPLRGNILFLDLDIVIINNIDCFFEYEKEKKFIIIEDWIYKKNNIKKYNSSVFRWNTFFYTNIFEDFLKERKKKNFTGDQDFLSEKINDAVYWPYDWCLSFKWNKCENKLFNKNNKIVVFHGKPKPKEMLSLEWIRKNTFF